MVGELVRLLSPRLSLTLIPRRFKSQRRSLGKPPGVAKTLSQRLQELKLQSEQLSYETDIGFQAAKKTRRDATAHIAVLKKNHSDPQLEKLSRDAELVLPLDEVEEEWAQTVGPSQIKVVAEYFGIYKHLFRDGFFLPVLPLKISFDNGDVSHPVYRGNNLKPHLTMKKPEVQFVSDSPDSYWTLIMSTPDGQPTEQPSETLHWMVTNIKGSSVESGNEVMKYLQPLPFKGTGFYRYIFVLYKQEGPLDFKISDCDRKFSTFDWYKEHEKAVTPAGLSFFQADWDSSVMTYNKEVVKGSDPTYSYDFPPHFHPPQKWFPIKQPFNLYMDRYRDQKEIAKEYVAASLRGVDPFSPPSPGLEFPNAVPFKKGTPSWLKTKMRKDRLKKAYAADFP